MFEGCFEGVSSIALRVVLSVVLRLFLSLFEGCFEGVSSFALRVVLSVALSGISRLFCCFEVVSEVLSCLKDVLRLYECCFEGCFECCFEVVLRLF